MEDDQDGDNEHIELESELKEVLEEYEYLPDYVVIRALKSILRRYDRDKNF